MTIDLNNVVVNEIISTVVGGSGAIVYSCTIDGWQCAMKEFEITKLPREIIDGIETEVSLLESLPQHKNLVRYLFHSR